MEDVIALSNVTVRFGAQTIFEGIDLSVPKGSVTILLGPGGSGKTTLFRLLTAGLLPDSGTVRVGGITTAELRGRKRAKFRQSIGAVFQDLPLLNDRTVEDQISLPMELAGTSRKRRREMLEAILDRFQLKPVRGVYPAALSMGIRQRVAIARAVATEPLVLLADEPAAHLDTAAQQEIAHIFQRENLRGMTILIATSSEQFASYFPKSSIQSFPPAAALAPSAPAAPAQN